MKILFSGSSGVIAKFVILCACCFILRESINEKLNFFYRLTTRILVRFNKLEGHLMLDMKLKLSFNLNVDFKDSNHD